MSNGRPVNLLGRLYIAGPMTGLPGKNYKAFHDAAAFLRAIGYEVVSPAELSDDETLWHEAMEKDIAALLQCDTVVLLPGWEASKGAQLEVSIARSMRMHIIENANIPSRLDRISRREGAA